MFWRDGERRKEKKERRKKRCGCVVERINWLGAAQTTKSENTKEKKKVQLTTTT